MISLFHINQKNILLDFKTMEQNKLVPGKEIMMGIVPTHFLYHLPLFCFHNFHRVSEFSSASFAALVLQYNSSQAHFSPCAASPHQHASRRLSPRRLCLPRPAFARLGSSSLRAAAGLHNYSKIRAKHFF